MFIAAPRTRASTGRVTSGATAPAGWISDAVGTPSRNHEPKREPSTGDNTSSDRHQDGEAIAAITIALGGVLACALFCKGHKTEPTAEDLLRDGPHFPTKFRYGTYPVQGLVRNGWPVFVDFMAAPGSGTTLDIVLNGASKKSILSYTLEAVGTGERHSIIVRLPAQGPADAAVPATLVVRSTMPNAYSTKAGGTARSPVAVFALGAGPKAIRDRMSASGVTDERAFRLTADPLLRFISSAPNVRLFRFTQARSRDAGAQGVTSPAVDSIALIQTPSIGGAAYQYRWSTDFSRAAADIERLTFTSDRIKVDPIFDLKQAYPVTKLFSSGRWDGRSKKGDRSRGYHRLAVRGWYTQDDQSWVGGTSNILQVQ